MNLNTAWEILLPLLTYIQANLDNDLSLAVLGRRAGLSPWYVHRLFKGVIGETPKHYVERLRLEKAAFRLMIHESSLLDTGLSCGYQSHETFTRAFKRHYGKTPDEYRGWARQAMQVRQQVQPPHSNAPQHGFEISATKIGRLRETHVAFIRHIGPYESVPTELFEVLEQWANANRLPGPSIWMGIGHDAPSTTPAQQLRFDAARVVLGPFAPEGQIAYQLLPEGEFAITTHAGPMDTLPAAYEAIFPRTTNLSGYTLIGLPAIEIYHATHVHVGVQHPLPHTDICLPVQRHRGRYAH